MSTECGHTDSSLICERVSSRREAVNRANSSYSYSTVSSTRMISRTKHKRCVRCVRPLNAERRAQRIESSPFTPIALSAVDRCSLNLKANAQSIGTDAVAESPGCTKHGNRLFAPLPCRSLPTQKPAAVVVEWGRDRLPIKRGGVSRHNGGYRGG